MSRETNTRTDFSSSGEPPSDSDRQGVSANGLAWYVRHLEDLEWTDHQSSTPNDMPVVNSILSDGQHGMTVTANAPQSDPYRSTYMGTGSLTLPSSNLVLSTSPTSNHFFSMNEPDRVSSTTTANHFQEHPGITFHLSPSETGRNDDTTLILLMPPCSPTASTNEDEWVNYFNTRCSRRNDGSEVGIEEAVDTQVAPTNAEHRERVMSRVWNTLMGELDARGGTTSSEREIVQGISLMRF